MWVTTERALCVRKIDSEIQTVSYRGLIGAAEWSERKHGDHIGRNEKFDELNKYFTISNMPIASSQYWNSIHGRGPGETVEDAEGLQTMWVLVRNMTFLMKSIALRKEKYGLPEKEEIMRTHFIRFLRPARTVSRT